MSAYPLLFLTIFVLGSIASLTKDPLWGLLTYIYVYFNIPNHQWWGYQLPDLRWSLIAAGILLASCCLHSDKLSTLSWRENQIGKWLLLFFVLMILIIPFSQSPSRSWIKIYDFFRYVVIFFIVVKVLNSFTRYKIFLGILLYCTFYLTLLAHHYFTGQRLDGVGLPDASSANMLAGLFVLFIPMYVVIGVTERGWKRWASFGALPFVMNSFVMCGSRGAFVGMLLQGFATLVLLSKRIGLRKAIACCIIIGVGLLYLMSDQYRDRLFGLKKGLAEESLAETSAGRWEIWFYGLDMVKDYPFGAGGDAFMALSPKYLPSHLMERNMGVRASHNTFLLVLVEQGILGLVAFLVFLCMPFRVLSRSRQTLLHIDSGDMTMEQRKIFFHTYAIQISLVGFWATSFFADRLYFECVYLFVAVVPAVFYSANRQLFNQRVNSLKKMVE